MKRILIVFIISISITGVIIGQVPNVFRYQAVVRDVSGELVANKLVGFEISILSGSAVGQVVYAEVFEPASNEFGLVTLDIGSGSTISGDFSQIDWSVSTYYLQIEIDIDGGDNYQFMGTSQILAVPYALQALNVINKDDADADPENEIQTLSQSGSDVTLSRSGGFFSINDNDADPDNEFQTITKTDGIVTLSNSGGSFADEVDDADANPTNEIQLLSKNGNTVTLSRSGGSFIDEINDADADPANEIQTITKNAGVVTLSNSGGSFVINDDDSQNEIQTITKEAGIVTLSNSGGSFVINDDDSQNEIQDLELSASNQLTITNKSNPTQIDLAQFLGTNTDNQILSTETDQGAHNNIVVLSITGLAESSVDIALPYDFVSRQNGGTFTGSVFAANLSGENTGDMDNADVVFAYQTGFPDHFTSVDGFKLDGIETGATADMSSTEIVSAYQTGYANYFNSDDHIKLNGIEAGARGDMTDDEIVTAYQTGNTNYFNSDDHTKLNSIETGARADMTNNEIVTAYQTGNVDYFSSVDHTKLDGIETGATADMSSTEIVSAYQAGNTDYFNSDDHTKLNGIETGARADMTNDEIVTAYQTGNTNYFNSEDHTKLNFLTLSNNFGVSGGSVQLTTSTTAITSLTLPLDGRLANESYVDNQISANALSQNLPSGQIFIGNSLGNATRNTLGGDATISNTGVLSLRDIGSAGTYRQVTVNDKGLVVSGVNPTTLAGYGILDAISSSLANGRLLIGNGGVAADVVMTGDAAITSAGVLTVSSIGEHDVTLGGTLNTGSNITFTNNAQLTFISDGLTSLILPTTGTLATIENTMSTSHDANIITSANIDNWNAAYGWGDHSSVGYLTALSSVTELNDITDEGSGAIITTAERTKLDGIAISANNYIHPATSGNFHIPSGGSSGQFLTWSSNGTAVWAIDNNTTYSVGDGGLTEINFTSALDTKLTGIETGADITDATNVTAAGAVMDDDFSTNGIMIRTGAGTYSHITDNSTNWNTAFGWGNHSSVGYLTALSSVTELNDITDEGSGAIITTAERTKLDGIAISANNYIHPATSGNFHIPSGGSSGQFLTWSSNGTAVWAIDNNTTYSVGDGGLTEINFTSALDTKLTGIETGADITDATNVTAAGAVMDDDFSTNGIMIRTGAGTYSHITDNSTNWNTAFGWGNHSAEGYLTALSGNSVTELNDITDAGSGAVVTDAERISWDNASSGSFTTVNISTVLNLTRLGAAPSSPNSGDIYFGENPENAGTDHLWCYIGGTWMQLDN